MFNIEQPPLLLLAATAHLAVRQKEASTTPAPLHSIRASCMTSRQTRLQEDTYYRVMQLLQGNPDMTQRQLALSLGVSVGGVNYCLNALIDKGWIKAQNFARSQSKLGYAYVLTPSGLAEKAALATRFLTRKMEEYEALKAEIETLTAELREEVPEVS